MLIEELKALKAKSKELHTYWPTEIHRNKIIVYLTCDSSVESLMPKRPADVESLTWLKGRGYWELERIDCAQRECDMNDSIIYWLRKDFVPDDEDSKFLNEYLSPQHQYFRAGVLEKWGIM
ncbi:hypothetical protein EG832_22290 [bacterium]|nr:hypothetical protein [bacterium]